MTGPSRHFAGVELGATECIAVIAEERNIIERAAGTRRSFISLTKRRYCA